MIDQAANLRRKVDDKAGINNGSRMIAIASGKGGVGKSNIAVNIGLALGKNNKRVLLMDADLGMANIDVLLGLTAKYNLSHVLHGECSLTDALLQGPGGLDILPGTSGVEELLNIDQRQVKRLISVSSQMGAVYDIILVDIGAGIHSSNINFISVCDEVLIVLTPEPTAIMDAYSLIKILYNHSLDCDIGLLINQVNSQQEGESVTRRMKKVIRDYLDIEVELIGLVPFDKHIRQAVKKQKALLELYPGSKSGQAFLRAGQKLIDFEKKGRSLPAKAGFVSRLLNLFK
ncbi:MAG: MinD/ParA family protein [Firmicutes bacterium]|nr:MinD/ParA family protein [Bacillota bacterium]